MPSWLISCITYESNAELLFRYDSKQDRESLTSHLNESTRALLMLSSKAYPTFPQHGTNLGINAHLRTLHSSTAVHGATLIQHAGLVCSELHETLAETQPSSVGP